ncbi:TonB-dependent siderophore receptor [Salinicola endophyticus]|uniref:TonB-dependent siderophore receptor n=1 Tax=Salinicola endophyticus TaxID=1949083 RepID=A0ABY8FBR9_9GAMM|nr:TonB-dependent siderophore receptor [Salinicola endophyticus]WFF40102.1 TonB-dependent siderophore receptor [Salinicola endophyticus]
MSSGNSSSASRLQARLVLTIVAMGSTPLAAPAWAQSSAGANHSLDTVTVTSTVPTYGDTPPPAFAGGQIAAGGRVGLLGEKDAMDIPFSVTSYTSKLIENQQSQTLGDTLRNDASINVGRGYGIYGESFKIRGFDVNGDDVSYGGLYGVLPRQIISSNIAERVEVFKGASAFASGIPVGGTSGVGGTINVEPKHAGNDPMLKLSTGYASDSYGEVGIDASRRFGDQKEWGARVSATRGRGDTAIDDEENRDTSVVVGLDYQGDRGRALFDFGHQKTTVKGGRSNVSTGVVSSVPDAPDGDVNYTPVWAGTRLETNFAMLRGEYDLNDYWTAYAAIGGSNSTENIVSGTPTLLDSSGVAQVTSGSIVRNDIENFASQAGFRGNFDTGPITHQMNLGYSSTYQRFDTDYVFATPSPGETDIYHPASVDEPDWSSPTFVGGGVTRTRAQGVTLSDTLGFFDDRVLLTLGARYQEMDIDEPGGVDSGGQRVTPAYGVLYKPTDNISLYANHIEALQVAGSNVVDATTGRRESLGLIHSKQNEIGAKFDYGTLGGGISLFEIEKPGVPDGRYDVVAGQKNRGVELSLYGSPAPSVRLFSSATWLDSELEDTEGFDGNDVPGVADYRLVLGGEWDVPHIERLTATGRVIRTGAQYADQANNQELDAWNRLDIGLRYTMPLNQANLIWRASVENVTGEDYWASASSKTGTSYLTQGEPRTFKLSATVEF